MFIKHPVVGVEKVAVNKTAKPLISGICLHLPVAKSQIN